MGDWSHTRLQAVLRDAGDQTQTSHVQKQAPFPLYHLSGTKPRLDPQQQFPKHNLEPTLSITRCDTQTRNTQRPVAPLWGALRTQEPTVNPEPR